MLPDRPIVRIEDDSFGRLNFVKSVAGALILEPDDDGLVVAIEGEWGSGKTSICNLIEQVLLQTYKETIIIKFNPWLISGKEVLTEAFLVQIASALGKADRQNESLAAAKKVLGFAKFLSPVKLLPGVEPWGTLVENVLKSVGDSAQAHSDLAKLDLIERKESVTAAITSIARPIVVFIDDIDRLLPEEIRVMFQLVKSVCDFKGVSYVLSYDPSPVESALGYLKPDSGRAYLEKIVQVAYPIPRLRYFQLKGFLEQKVESFVASKSLRLDDFEKKRIEDALSSCVTHCMKHPRDIVRLLNRIRISAIPTRGEVNLGDIIAYETLALKYKPVADTLRRRPYDFIGRNSEDEYRTSDFDAFLDDEGENKRLPEWKIALWKELSEEARRDLWGLIDFLFPRFRKKDTVRAQNNAEGNLFICSEAALLKLLTVGDIQGYPSKALGKEFLQHSTSRAEILTALIKDAELAGWFSNLESLLPITEPENPVELVSTVVKEILPIISDKDKDLISEISDFFIALISCLNDSETKKEIFLGVANTPSCLSIGHDVILQAIKEHGKWSMRRGEEQPDDKKMLKEWEVVETGRDAWLAKVRCAISNPVDFLREPKLLSILFRWGQFLDDDYSEVKLFTSSLMQNKKMIAILLKILNRPQEGYEQLFSSFTILKETIDEQNLTNDVQEELLQYIIHAAEKEKMTQESFGAATP